MELTGVLQMQRFSLFGAGKKNAYSRLPYLNFV